MKSSEEVFRKNWVSIVTAAIMHRVQRPADNAEKITMTKTVFDDLVSVAEVASRVRRSQANKTMARNHFTRNSQNIDKEVHRNFLEIIVDSGATIYARSK